MHSFLTPSIETLVEHGPLICLGLRQNESVFSLDAPYHDSFTTILCTKKSLCFISVYVKFADLIAFVELGTGLNK